MCGTGAGPEPPWTHTDKEVRHTTLGNCLATRQSGKNQVRRRASGPIIQLVALSKYDRLAVRELLLLCNAPWWDHQWMLQAGGLGRTLQERCRKESQLYPSECVNGCVHVAKTRLFCFYSRCLWSNGGIYLWIELSFAVKTCNEIIRKSENWKLGTSTQRWTKMS